MYGSVTPNRKHKMVFVDFSNPYLARYLASGRYAWTHFGILQDVALNGVPRLVAQAHQYEGNRAKTEGLDPRPLAATVDIDEVILSNIHMNVCEIPGVDGQNPVVFHAADYFIAPNGKPWPRNDLRLNPLLPGARLFLETLRAHNIEIFFITGRLESIRDETIENFKYVGLMNGSLLDEAALARGPDSRLLMCPDGDSPGPGESIRPFKESCRKTINMKYHIVLNIGDQVSDLGNYGDVQIHTVHPFYVTP